MRQGPKKKEIAAAHFCLTESIMLYWGSSSLTSSHPSADKKNQLAMVAQGASSVLGATLLYQFHAICRPPKSSGLTPRVCPVCTAFMPPEWGIGSWVLWRICFIIFLHRKLQQNKTISLCISPIPNLLNQGAMVTIQHRLYAPHLIQELLQLFTLGTSCILQVFAVTLNNPELCSRVKISCVLRRNFEMVFTNYVAQRSSLEKGESVLVNYTIKLSMKASRSSL